MGENKKNSLFLLTCAFIITSLAIVSSIAYKKKD